MVDQPTPPLPYVPGLDDDPDYLRWREETKRKLGLKSDDSKKASPSDGLHPDVWNELWNEMLPPEQAQAVREERDRKRGIVMGEAMPDPRSFDRVKAAEDELRMRRAKPARVVIEQNA